MVSNDEIKAHLDFILVEVAKTQNIQNFEFISNTNTGFGDGFISQFFTGEIQNKDTEETTSVAIKKVPLWHQHYEPLFNNEYFFYNTIFPALDHLQKVKKVSQPFNNVPNYYCGNITDKKKEYIAMEYLKPYGYVMHDKSKVFNQEHLEFIFKTYGKFHALSFVLRKQNLEIYQHITKNLVNSGLALADLAGHLIKESISAAINALNKDEYKNIPDNLKDFGNNAEIIFRQSQEYNGDIRCLVHGDCWSNNFLFKYSDSGKLLNIKLLDFQICRDGTLIHDLSYFFYSGATKKDFDNIDFFLKIYYKSFVEFANELGVKSEEIFSFEVLVNEWKNNALLGIIFAIWLWQLKLTNKEDLSKIIEENRGSEKERDDALKDLRNKIYESSTYKENTTAILIHAIEYGIITNDNILIK